MEIKHFMTKKVATISSTDNLGEAARLMWECDCGIIPVCEEQQIIGMITDRDIAMAAHMQGCALTQIQVSKAMSHEVFSCNQNDDLSSAEDLMQKNKVRRLPVVDDSNQLVGIISLNDIAIAFSNKEGKIKANEIADTLAKVCSHRAASGTSAKAA